MSQEASDWKNNLNMLEKRGFLMPKEIRRERTQTSARKAAILLLREVFPLAKT